MMRGYFGLLAGALGFALFGGSGGSGFGAFGVWGYLVLFTLHCGFMLLNILLDWVSARY